MRKGLIFTIIIGYSLVALVLTATLGGNYQNALVDEDIDYDYHNSNITYLQYDDEEGEWVRINYEDMIPESTSTITYYENQSYMLTSWQRIGIAVERFGTRPWLSTGVNTGINWLDIVIKIYLLPLSSIVNICQFGYELITAITGINFDTTNQGSWFDNWIMYNWNYMTGNGDFTDGSSYGGGGGGVHGGR